MGVDSTKGDKLILILGIYFVDVGIKDTIIYMEVVNLHPFAEQVNALKACLPFKVSAAVLPSWKKGYRNQLV